MPLFKYYPPARVEDLANFRVRYSPPKDFADPFDSSPAIISRVKDEFLRPIYEDAINIAYQRFISQFTRPLLRAEYQRKYAPNFAFWKQKLEGSEFAVTEWLKTREKFLTVFGVFCLCRSGDSAAMWAHYAEGQKGFQIEFDEDHDFFVQHRNESKGSIVEVEYVKNRHFVGMEGPPDFAHFFKYKSLDWAYEKEVRLLKHLAAKSGAENDTLGKPTLFKMPTSAIKALTVGSNMELKYLCRLKTLLLSENVNHVSVFHAKPDPIHFLVNRVSGWPP